MSEKHNYQVGDTVYIVDSPEAGDFVVTSPLNIANLGESDTFDLVIMVKSLDYDKLAKFFGMPLDAVNDVEIALKHRQIAPRSGIA